jgi:hypothetical protein
MLTEASAYKINVKANNVIGAVIGTAEPILCARATDTPRLLLLSGIGPADHSKSVSVPIVRDIPGVGKNLMGHADSTLLYEINSAPPTKTTVDSDGMVTMRREPVNEMRNDIASDVHLHMYPIPLETHTKRLGCDVPNWDSTIMPNVP